jgi:cobalt-precorrin 5A hydrolase
MITAGFGFRREAKIESLLELYSQLCKTYLGEGQVDVLATHVKKSQADAFIELSHRTGIEIIAITDAEITSQDTINHSDLSIQLYKTGSLAEATALAAAGANSRLLGGRIVSQDRLATCAFAKGDNS